MRPDTSEEKLRFRLMQLDGRRFHAAPMAKDAATVEVLAMIRERGGYYDFRGIRYVARGDGLYRTLPT